MEENKKGVHTTHCCAVHGCKYGDHTCPVVTGEVEQTYPCQDCNDDFYQEFVLITGCKSLPFACLGSYGKLMKYSYSGKWFVELKGTVGKAGSLSHNVHHTDFKVI
jgi:hypothetical protein